MIERTLTTVYQNLRGLSALKATRIQDRLNERENSIFVGAETWLTDKIPEKLKKSVFANITKIVERTPNAKGKIHGRQSFGGLIGLASNRETLNKISIIEEDENRNYLIYKIGDCFFVMVYFSPSKENDESLIDFLDRIEAFILENENVFIVGDFNMISAARGSFPPAGGRIVEKRTFLIDFFENRLHMRYISPERNTRQNSSINARTRPDHVWTNSKRQTRLFYDTDGTANLSDHLALVLETSIIEYFSPPKRFERIHIANCRTASKLLSYSNAIIDSFFELDDYLDEEFEKASPGFQQPSFKEKKSVVTVVCEKVNSWLRKAAYENFGVYNADSKRSDEFWNGEIRRLNNEIVDVELSISDLTENQKKRAFARLKELKECLQAKTKEKNELLWEKMTIMLEDDPTLFAKFVSSSKFREHQTGCKLDPAKINEHVKHFEGTFGCDPKGSPEDFVFDDDDTNISKYCEPDEFIFRHEHEKFKASPLENLFTHQKIFRIIQEMDTGKSCGSDGIYSEILKIVYEDNGKIVKSDLLARILAKFFKLVKRYGVIPDQWCHAKIAPIWKQKGSPLDIRNYRPIAVTSVLRRIFEKCILQSEFAEKINSKLEYNQGGFRPNRSTLHQVLTLHEVMANNKNAIKVFMDIKAAYDCVDRRILWIMLSKHFEIDDETIALLQSLFEENFTTLLVNGSESEILECIRGLLQGSSLSPILFNVFINELIYNLNRSGVECGLSFNSKFFINCLFFADDFLLITNSVELMKILLFNSNRWARSSGISFAILKCEFLAPPETAETLQLDIDGQYLQQAKEDRFAYLGITIDNNGINFIETNRLRIAKAKNVLEFLCRKGFNTYGWFPSSKIAAYKMFIRPMIEYGLSIGCVPDEVISELQKFQNLAIRKAFSLGRNVSINGMHHLTGIQFIEHRIWDLSARFHLNILNLPDKNETPIGLTYKALLTEPLNSEDQRENHESKYDSIILHVWKENPILLKATENQLEYAPINRTATPKQFCERNVKNKAKVKFIAEQLSLQRISTDFNYIPSEPDNINGSLFSRTFQNGRREILPKDSFKKHPCMNRHNFRNHIEQEEVIRWMLGQIHRSNKKCLHCDEMCRRIHCLECSGADAYLREKLDKVTVSTFKPEKDYLFIDHALRVTFAQVYSPKYDEYGKVISNPYKPSKSLRKRIRKQTHIIYEALCMIRVYCFGWNRCIKTGIPLKPEKPIQPKTDPAKMQKLQEELEEEIEKTETFIQETGLQSQMNEIDQNLESFIHQLRHRKKRQRVKHFYQTFASKSEKYGKRSSIQKRKITEFFKPKNSLIIEIDLTIPAIRQFNTEHSHHSAPSSKRPRTGEG